MARKWTVSPPRGGRPAYTNIYDPLRAYLTRYPGPQPTLIFSEIESILGTRLPREARTDKRWWRNYKSSWQASAWLSADCRVIAVDLVEARVTFRKWLPSPLRQICGEPVWDRYRVRALRRHMKLQQAGLAKLVGVVRSMVCRWETGTYIPTSEMGERLTSIARQAKFPLD